MPPLATPISPVLPKFHLRPLATPRVTSTRREVRATPAEKARALNQYAASLAERGYFSKAVAPAMTAYQFHKNPLLVTHILTKAGLFHRAANLIRHHQLADDSLILRTEQFMDQHGVSDAVLQQLIEITISVLHAHQFFDFHSVQFGFAADENSQWFRYVIVVNRSVEEIVDLKYELACQLAESDLSTELLLHFLTVYEIAVER